MRLTREQLADLHLLEVRPGDLLVFECDAARDADALAEELRAADPPFRFEALIVGPGVKVRVARQTEEPT